ncbi:hypothetical protein C2G38_2228581 [Gigaspora rosea]|uniref:Uncharacterized protein n=1 Tax=Gigaspora rosea TaxID=44941 RepID=A0A397TVN3_9GLOM|nr:hypothetical protein C2G38_2228581 [Gigaspora rosea]
MKILCQKSRETKAEFFGKRGWSLHSVLMYTKDPNTNKINVNAFDYWSSDSKQDAWFTASSLHGVLETIEIKPKRIRHNIESGEEIQEAIKDLAGTHAANILSNLEENLKLGTMHGISNWHEWTWPDEETDAGYILARSLPGLGS